jgi:transcriptional regulator
MKVDVNVSKYISIDVEVDVDATEVIDELGDDDLRKECQRRGLTLHDEDEIVELVREALRDIHQGRVVDAVTVLERLCYPKWSSADACLAQLGRTTVFGRPA